MRYIRAVWKTGYVRSTELFVCGKTWWCWSDLIIQVQVRSEETKVQLWVYYHGIGFVVVTNAFDMTKPSPPLCDTVLLTPKFSLSPQ